MSEQLTEGQLFALKVGVALLVALGSALWWCWTRIQRQIARVQLRHPILHQPKVPKVPKVFRDVRRSISSKLQAYRTGFLDEQSRKPNALSLLFIYSRFGFLIKPKMCDLQC